MVTNLTSRWTPTGPIVHATLDPRPNARALMGALYEAKPSFVLAGTLNNTRDRSSFGAAE